MRAMGRRSGPSSEFSRNDLPNLNLNLIWIQGALITLHNGALLEDPLALVWHPRPEMPNYYFKRIISHYFLTGPDLPVLDLFFNFDPSEANPSKNRLI